MDDDTPTTGQPTGTPWDVGIRLARQHLDAGAPAHLETQLQLIYGDDLLTAAERRELGFERAVRRLEAFVAEHGRQPRKCEAVDGFRIGQWVVRSRHGRGKLSPERVARLEQIPGWTWDAFAAAFDEGYARLVAFVAEHGRQPQCREMADGFPLGQWVVNRRREHEKLSGERVTRLEAVPGWSWDLIETAFEVGYACLLDFVAEHGRQPKTTEVVNEFNLGNWAARRRSERDSLSPERYARLEAVPGWSWSPIEAAFEDGYTRLTSFVAEHGRQPQAREVVDGFLLGEWVASRRSEREKLSAERVARLEQVPGWTWGVARADRFEDGYARLVAFVAEHGRQPMPGEEVDGFNLGEWVAYRRREREKLSAERVARLEQVPGWTWGVARADRFEDGYARLVAFVAEHGRQPRRSEVAEGFNLGTWVVNRRKRRANLSAGTIARLEAVPGWTWAVPRRPAADS